VRLWLGNCPLFSPNLGTSESCSALYHRVGKNARPLTHQVPGRVSSCISKQNRGKDHVLANPRRGLLRKAIIACGPVAPGLSDWQPSRPASPGPELGPSLAPGLNQSGSGFSCQKLPVDSGRGRGVGDNGSSVTLAVNCTTVGSGTINPSIFKFSLELLSADRLG
jgi:hypothetical protein